MALWAFISAVAIYGTLTDAIPTITFPLNSQVPPVARVSQLFTYTFSSSTFSSTLPITYTLSSGPIWLSLDSSTRTLSGTPTVADAGADAVTGIPIGITASDSSGSFTSNATLVISINPAPVVNIPITAQLQSFAAFSAPSTLLYHPSTPFTFNLQPGTFLDNGVSSGLTYYAITIDNTPLPSWISFNGNSLTFTGLTPDYHSLIQPPQTFGIQLVASDVEGFSGTSINFDIEVGIHLLAFKNAYLVVNATVGKTINFSGLAASLEIDGQAANGSSIASITAQTPSWVIFDNSTLVLSGTVPDDATPSNITVQATDIYGDTANAVVYIDIFTSIFAKEIGSLNATIGLSFSYDLSVYLQNKSDVDLTTQFSPPEPWISFDSQKSILAGQVPTTAKPSFINVTLHATSKSTNKSGSQAFELVVTSASTSASTLPLSRTTVPSTSQTGRVATVPASSRNHLSRTDLILAIVLPIVTVLLCIFLALFCYVRQRREARRDYVMTAKSEISKPTEASSSVTEIVRTVYITPPKPLELDMSGFGGSETRALHPTSPKRTRRQDIRRSQTQSVMSGGRHTALQESDTSGNRTRSYSDNVLSKGESSWRSTQDSSSYPTVGNLSSRTNSSNTQRNGVKRQYSNYSRKGHPRRSASKSSATLIISMPEVSSNLPPGESILNLRDSNFSFAPLERFSVIGRDPSLRQPDEAHASNRLSRTKTTRRQSRLMPTLNRPTSGLGHGGRRDSPSSLSATNGKRHSIGHGQDWISNQALARNSKTWLTIGSSEFDDQNRRSAVSALSEYDEMKPEDVIRLSTMRQVTKSPSIPRSAGFSPSSGNSRNSRQVSRRVDSSPFFGGSASRSKRRSSKKMRTSYADSPTVPEEMTMAGNLDTMLDGLKEEDVRDSFGISYGLARESTRQLKSFVSRLSRSRTRSMASNESKDSRFESASGSMVSMDQFQSQQPVGNQGRYDEYEDYLPDSYSAGSWETQPSNGVVRDSQENVIEYSAEDLPAADVAATQPSLRPNLDLVPRHLGSLPNSPMVEMGPNMRMVASPSRRPLSVDAKNQRQGSTRVQIERDDSDFTAYI